MHRIKILNLLIVIAIFCSICTASTAASEYDDLVNLAYEQAHTEMVQEMRRSMSKRAVNKGNLVKLGSSISKGLIKGSSLGEKQTKSVKNEQKTKIFFFFVKNEQTHFCLFLLTTKLKICENRTKMGKIEQKKE
jgi:hypothetical protein